MLFSESFYELVTFEFHYILIIVKKPPPYVYLFLALISFKYFFFSDLFNDKILV